MISQGYALPFEGYEEGLLYGRPETYEPVYKPFLGELPPLEVEHEVFDWRPEFEGFHTVPFIGIPGVCGLITFS